MKLCKKCSTEKPLSDFHANRECRDGRESTCKVCKRDKRRSLRVPKPPRWSAFDPNAIAKLCNKCGTERSLSEFYDSPGRRGDKASYCKECTRTYTRGRYADPGVKQKKRDYTSKRRSDPEFVEANKRRSADYYESVLGRARTLLAGARRRYPACTVTLDHIVRGIERGSCPVTGIIFDLTTKHQEISGRSKSPYSPSLDRIHSKLGYTNENTRIVIWQYNMAKGELSDAEVMFICKQVVVRSANAVA